MKITIILILFCLAARSQTTYTCSAYANFNDTLDVGDFVNIYATPGFGNAFLTSIVTTSTTILNPFSHAIQQACCASDTFSSGMIVRYGFPINGAANVEITNPCVITKFFVGITSDGVNYIYHEYNVRPNSVLGVQDHHREFGIKIYPNPALNEFYVSLNENTSKPIVLSLFDCMGQLVIIESYLQSADHKMNIEKLSSGIYTLQVTNGERTSFQKIVKE